MEGHSQEYRIKIYCCMYQGCQKEYQTKYNLSRHIEVNHLKKKVGKCDICQKEFIDFENLKEHQNIHKDIKPYKCDTCGKSYRNKCMLVRHARDHKFRPIEKKLAIKYSCTNLPGFP